jgi:hypothetical protein
MIRGVFNTNLQTSGTCNLTTPVVPISVSLKLATISNLLSQQCKAQKDSAGSHKHTLGHLE